MVDPELLTAGLENEKESMNSRDFYKELRLRGYHYSGLFRAVKSATTNGTKGRINWSNNWVAFMDNMLQMQIIGLDTRGLFVPTGIQKLVINTKKHLDHLRSMSNDESVEFPVYVNKTLDIVASGGVQVRGLKASAIARRKPAGDPVLEEYKFVANADRAEVSIRDAARLSAHIAMENNLGIKIKTLELLEEADKVPVEQLVSPYMSEALGDMPLIQADVSIVGNNIVFEDDALPSNIVVNELKKIATDGSALLAVGHRLLQPERAENLELLIPAVKEGGFLVSRESPEIKNIEDLAKAKGLHVILQKIVGKDLFVLLRKVEKAKKKTLVINISNEKFNWVEEMQKTMKEVLEKENPGTVKIIYVGQEGFENGTPVSC